MSTITDYLNIHSESNPLNPKNLLSSPFDIFGGITTNQFNHPRATSFPTQQQPQNRNFGTFYNNLIGNPENGKYTTGLFKGISTGMGAALGGMATAAGGAVGNLLSQGMSSGAGDIISGIGDIASQIPGPVGMIAGAASKVLAGATNALFGSKLNQENIDNINSQIADGNRFTSNAGDLDQLAQNFANQATIGTFNKSDIGKEGALSNKVTNLFNEMSNNANLARMNINNQLSNNTNNILSDLNNNKIAFSAAYGGELHTQGGNFTNGLITINNGGTHESNPYEGVPMGIDQQGVPNLVEEGEAIFNDYVFSKRMKVPKKLYKKYALGGPLTFADAAIKLSKESEERPNDPISQNGLEALLGELAYTQEALKARRQRRNSYAYGGKVNKFWNGGYKFYGQDQDDALQFMTDGKYSEEYRKYVDNITEAQMAANYHTLQQWYNKATKEQKNTKRYKNLHAYFSANPELKSFDFSKGTLPEGLFDFTKTGGLDYNVGGRHYALMDETQRKNLFGDLAAPDPITKTRYYKLGPAKDANGTPIDPKAGASLIDYDPNKPMGLTWDSDTNTVEDGINYLNRYYKEGTPTSAANLKLRFRDDKESPWTVYDSMDAAIDAGVDLSKYDSGKDGENFRSFTKLKDSPPMPLFDDPLRYAGIAGPIVGLGASLFSKPNMSSANAILQAAKTAGRYTPARFRPVGNYLTPQYFDLEYAANQANKEAAASRSAIMNSGNTPSATMAGIIAADNNALNQLGNLRIGAFENKVKNKLAEAEYYRGTDQINSEGDSRVSLANQQALLNSGSAYLNGVAQAESLRQQERLDRQNAIQGNLSGLFTSAANIGAERVARQQFKWLTDNGYVRPYKYGAENKAKYGGKIKRKKTGLTY